ncbi:Hsp70 family protein [Aspergillus tubingensis]|uniref:Hsp70 family protein n=1 Tax=Aspergillus tubingensis TaxID=5068 RepID=UPI001578687B|nr:actin-like ATPase domain-containing protein [Aspergillus tubingensis]GFN20630.1 actin-like ATPase domain-containing protein [Aspergillus tubingensis]
MPLRVAEDGKIMVGVSYSLRSLEVRGGEDNDHLIDEWPAANSREITASKVPTIVQYEHKTVRGIKTLEATRWGAQVLASKENCSSLFKPLLEPNFDRDHDPYAFWNSTVGHGGFFLPEAKEPSDVIKDYLDCVWKYSSKTIFKNTRQGPSYHPVHYTITVPGIWARETRKALERIVKDAGLATKTNDILTMIPEPIAAAVDIFRKKADTFQGDVVMLVCDIGGGTIDVGSVFIRQTEFGRYIRQLEPTRGDLGMLSVEAAFYRTMYERFKDTFKNQNTESIGPSSAWIREFRDCFERFAPENLEEHGWECRLPFWSLLSSNNPDFYDRRRKEIFLSARDIQAFLDPVIDMAHAYLVGGGAENAYILRSVKRRIKDKHALDVYTPDKPQLAVVNGAGV